VNPRWIHLGGKLKKHQRNIHIPVRAPIYFNSKRSMLIYIMLIPTSAVWFLLIFFCYNSIIAFNATEETTMTCKCNQHQKYFTLFWNNVQLITVSLLWIWWLLKRLVSNLFISLIIFRLKCSTVAKSILFRNPFILRHFPNKDYCINSWISTRENKIRLYPGAFTQRISNVN